MAVETGLVPSVEPASFAVRFPQRHIVVPPPAPELVNTAVKRAADGGPVFVGAPTSFLLGVAYPEIVRGVVRPQRNVKLVGVPGAARAQTDPPAAAVRDELGTMRSLPAITVVAPADAPTTRAATVALAEREGPAYVQLPAEGSPVVTDGTFAVGRAPELHAGHDLTVVALGSTVASALELAADLARVGVMVRVLDAASVKPLDEGAILRAARDTGALLVVEPAPVATGIGTLVAAMTAENYPVPVRRVGLADRWAAEAGTAAPAELSSERIRDEAWELLRLRGKAT